LSTMRRFIAVFALASFWLWPGWCRGDDPVQYNRDIRPILANACFKCHGPAARKGGFRLDLREEAVKATKSGAMPIVAGKPEQSEMIKRIYATDADEMMTAPSWHRTLKVAEKELTKRL